MNSEQVIEVPNDRTEERSWLDLTGTAVSWLCVVHCVVHCGALPFFISLLPIVGLSFLLDETLEWTIIGVSVLIAAASLLPAYYRRHGKIRTIILFAAGVCLICFSHLMFEDELRMQIPFLLAGAGLISAAHFINRRLCRKCAVCRVSRI